MVSQTRLYTSGARRNFQSESSIVSFPDAPPTRGKERLVTIDAKLGPNDVIYPAVVEYAIIISWAFN